MGRREGKPRAIERALDTKKAALDRARQIIRRRGGGELRIHDKDGVFIDSDTIKPGRESPRKDTK